MCGIVGMLADKAVAADLVDALQRLEYRGYDSAGVATIENGKLDRRRAEGKLENLRTHLQGRPINGTIGIGHTRWATHGRPSELNAHPHMSDCVSVVHNGIIENYRELRQELIAKGHVFDSETDTQVVVHLITEEMRQGRRPIEATRVALDRLRGSFALAIIFAGENDLMIGARQGSPLAVGHGPGEMYLGSDAIALPPLTDAITYLEEGDWCVLTRTSLRIFDRTGRYVERPAVKASAQALLVDKGKYRHYMAKEIHEQPDVIGRTLERYIDKSKLTVKLPELRIDLAKISHVTISSCGTAYYAGLVAKYWIERYARLPVEIDVASEFRYREIPLSPGGLSVFVSQSGETADTLEALRYCKRNGQTIVGVVNVPTSTIARESHCVIPTLAGPEIGVASTKAFTCQLAVLACLAIALGRARGAIDSSMERELIKALLRLPQLITSVLGHEKQYEKLAREIAKARDVLYLGRGVNYPIALEGALKLKEISYIHAEGYAAGELKHGPIALIDDVVPVIVVAPEDRLFEKTVSNMQEVAARGGRILFVSDAPRDSAGCKLMGAIKMPKAHALTAPILYAIPMQLLAYHTAVKLGADVDQPRNLAKSVTVE